MNELKSQLDQAEGSKSGSVEDLEAEMMGITSRRKTAQRHQEQLRRMEKERKENQEVLLLLNHDT